MQPVIKGQLRTRNNLIPLAEFSPSDSSNFCIEVEVIVGSEENTFTNIFWVKVCTPDWLQNEIIRIGKPMSGRGLLITEYFSAEQIKKRLIEILNGCSADSWDLITIKVAQYLEWEFD